MLSKKTAGPVLAVLATFPCMDIARAQTIQQGEATYDAATRVNKPLPAHPSSKPVVPPFEHPDALFPDPAGVLSWLRSKGVAFLMSTTNEFSGAATKPTPGFSQYRQGASGAGQVNTSLHMDWSKLAGIPGFATHTIFTSRYGMTGNRMFGDWLGHSSEIYGGAGNVVLHLVMAYGEENLLGGRIAIAGGRVSELTDFSSSPLFCNFVNNSICGRPRAAADNDFISRYPAGVWGVRFRGRPSQYTYVQTGVYFPERNMFGPEYNRSGFKFSGGSAIRGQSVPVEMGWEPRFGAQKGLPGHYKIGARLMNVPLADVYADDDGRSFAWSRRSARQHPRSWGTWFEADQKIWVPHQAGHPASGDRGTTILAGFILNDKRVSLRHWQTYFGVVNRGFIASRPEDALNIIGMYEAMSPGVSATEAAYLDQGLIARLPYRATGVQTHAAVLEANYQIQVMRGVAIAPDYQIFINPNGQNNLRTAHVFGFKSTVQIF
ncbi:MULTISPECIES: carbohydrate porin [unclassified Asaia]|uniref:carbohydrate porin n=1 Tax=unclassified Asaia TaxID=2685023 RepID=UPI001F3A1870|nr:carbohydrate porin [Asaia sp. W19]